MPSLSKPKKPDSRAVRSAKGIRRVKGAAAAAAAAAIEAEAKAKAAKITPHVGELSGKQRHHLRGLGHDKKPLVQIGKGGLDQGVIAAVNQALTDHELIKVRLGESSGLDREVAATELARATQSQIAQILGNIFLLFRSHPDKPRIALP